MYIFMFMIKSVAVIKLKQEDGRLHTQQISIFSLQLEYPHIFFLSK